MSRTSIMASFFAPFFMASRLFIKLTSKRRELTSKCLKFTSKKRKLTSKRTKFTSKRRKLMSKCTKLVKCAKTSP